MGHSPIARAKGSLTLPANTHLVYNGYQKTTMSTPEPAAKYEPIIDGLRCHLNQLRHEFSNVQGYCDPELLESLEIDLREINQRCVDLRDRIERILVENLPY